MTLVDESVSYRGFSCPYEPLDDALLEGVAIRHYRRALRTYVLRHAEFLEQRGSGGLVDVCRRWFDSDVDFETVWHLAFGKMREVLGHRMPEAEILSSGARIGLRLVEMGMTGDFEVELGSVVRFRFGRWLLPECDRLSLHAERDGCELVSFLRGARQPVRLEKAEGAEWMALGARPIPTFDTGSREIGVLLPETPEGVENMEHPLQVDAATREAIWSSYRAAFDVLAEYAPPYVRFVDRLLRQLVPVQAGPGRHVDGGSLRDNPGVVKLPFGREPVGHAANLGHESAHQYYFLLRGAGPVTDGSDQNLYHSPFVEAERDLDTIVLTYHAFANEALVARASELAGIEDPYARSRAELIRKTLAPLEEILDRSTALTALGRALTRPAAEHLHRAFS
jgi:HEXXH motif-containing protein